MGTFFPLIHISFSHSFGRRVGETRLRAWEFICILHLLFHLGLRTDFWRNWRRRHDCSLTDWEKLKNCLLTSQQDNCAVFLTELQTVKCSQNSCFYLCLWYPAYPSTRTGYMGHKRGVSFSIVSPLLPNCMHRCVSLSSWAFVFNYVHALRG